MDTTTVEQLLHHAVWGSGVPAAALVLGLLLGVAFVHGVGRRLSRYRAVWYVLVLLPFRTALLGGILYWASGILTFRRGYDHRLNMLLMALLLAAAAFLVTAAVLQIYRFSRAPVLAAEIWRDLYFFGSALVALAPHADRSGLASAWYLQLNVGDLEGSYLALGLMLAVCLAVEISSGVLECLLDALLPRRMPPGGSAAPPIRR